MEQIYCMFSLSESRLPVAHKDQPGANLVCAESIWAVLLLPLK